MSPGTDRVYEEAAALWRELYDEPPPAADGPTLLDMITRRLPARTYERLTSPHMRAAAVSYPKSNAR